MLKYPGCVASILKLLKIYFSERFQRADETETNMQFQIGSI